MLNAMMATLLMVMVVLRIVSFKMDSFVKSTLKLILVMYATNLGFHWEPRSPEA